MAMATSPFSSHPVRSKRNSPPPRPIPMPLCPPPPRRRRRGGPRRGATQASGSLPRRLAAAGMPPSRCNPCQRIPLPPPITCPLPLLRAPSLPPRPRSRLRWQMHRSHLLC
jgi:hypothetical protein